MARGIPTEEILTQMRASDPPVLYLVGTPKGRLSELEEKLTARPWVEARDGVEVQLLPGSGEAYGFAQSRDRVHKERALRRRQMRWLRDRLKELVRMKPKRDALLMKLGAAQNHAPAAWRWFAVRVPDAPRRKKGSNATTQTPEPGPEFSFARRWDKRREARRREDRYLVRCNLPERPPEQWGGILSPTGAGRTGV